MSGCRKRSNSSCRFLCAFDSVDEVPLPILLVLELALGLTSSECFGIEEEGFCESVASGGAISSSREARAVWRSSIFPASRSFDLRFIRLSCDLEKCVVLGPNFFMKASRRFTFLLRPTGSDIVEVSSTVISSTVALLAPLTEG